MLNQIMKYVILIKLQNITASTLKWRSFLSIEKRWSPSIPVAVYSNELRDVVITANF